MKNFLIIAVVLIVVVVIISIAISIYKSIGKDENSLSNQDSDTILRSFSFNHSEKNDMDDGMGDSRYFYLSNTKVVIELWGYGREDVVDIETKINTEEYLILEQDILDLIEKYSIEPPTQSVDDNFEDDVYVTDQHSSFSITIRYRDSQTVSITAFPDNYFDMVADLEEIFASYIS